MIVSLLFLCSAIVAVSGMTPPAPKYVVELYGVVEPQVVRNYMKIGYTKSQAESNIKGDIEFFLNEINKYYESMRSSNLFIEVRLKKWQISASEVIDKSEISSDGRVLNAYKGLDIFKEWLGTTKAYDMFHQDVAILWTGYDLQGRSGSTSKSGLTTTASVCYPHKAAGIVEFDGTQRTASTTAHELAHALGTRHDKGAECAPFMGYLMTPNVSPKNEKRWGFSQCSIRSIKKNIAKLDRKNQNCLIQTTTERAHFDITKHYGRDLFDVHKICQRYSENIEGHFNGDSSFYEGKPPKGDKVCQNLACKLNGKKKDVVPTESLVCDVGKRCKKGKCVSAPTPKDVIPDCLFGDLLTSTKAKVKGYCESLIKTKGLGVCYKYSTWKDCCATCASKRTDNKDCEFGDKYQRCSQYTPDEICPYFKKECCGTCSDFRVKRSVENDTAVEPSPFDDDDEDVDEDYGDLDDDDAPYDDINDGEDEDDDDGDDDAEDDEDEYSYDEHFDNSETEDDGGDNDKYDE